MRARALSALALAAALLASAPANAAVEPDRAAEDLEHARALGKDAFCTQPRKPLDGRARALCGHATAVPRCEALAAACDEKRPADKPAWTPPEWLIKLAIAAVWVVLAGVVAIGAGLAVWMLLRARRDRAIAGAERGGNAEEVEAAPAGHAALGDAEVLLRRADALAEGGALDEALAIYLRASLVALDGRGAIALLPGRTNGEYVRACAEPGAKRELSAVVGDVERVRYGRASASADVARRVGARAAAIVRAAVGLGATLAMLALLGSCAGDVPGTGGDPAGTDLLEGVLSIQGVEVRGLARPLAELVIPEDDDTPVEPAAVFVDLERTPIDEDTRAHLAAWVDAGGTLIIAGGAPGFVPLKAASADGTKVVSEGTSKAGMVLAPGGFQPPEADCTAVATIGHGTPFAVVCAHGAGRVMAMAEDDLVANVGFARGANAEVALAILAHLAPTEIAFARRDDGVAPPTSPLASLDRAGLRLGLWHGLAAALLLFWAAGTRLARPRPEPPPSRRAFVEHVEATGALHARARTAPRALASYVRWVEEHVRAAPGSSVAAALAARTGANLEECERLWAEAHDPEPGTELRVLGRLHALHARARRS